MLYIKFNDEEKECIYVNPPWKERQTCALFLIKLYQGSK